MAASIRVLRFDDLDSRALDGACRISAVASAAASDNSSRGGWGLNIVTLAAGASWRADEVSFAAWLEGASASGFSDGVTRCGVGDDLVAREPSRVVVLSVDPTRAVGSLEPLAEGHRDLVGMSWFVVAATGLDLRINEGDSAALHRGDTARIDLRAQPVSRLTIARHPLHDVVDEGSPVGASASRPVAFLASAAR